MGDAVLFFFIKNLLFFSILFWVLLLVGSYFYKIKNQASKRHFCECGFKSLSDINIQININFAMLCVFLVLYDVEFTIIFPILFNMWYVCALQLIVLLVFILFVVVSLFYDWQMNALSWQV